MLRIPLQFCQTRALRVHRLFRYPADIAVVVVIDLMDIKHLLMRYDPVIPDHYRLCTPIRDFEMPDLLELTGIIRNESYAQA